MANFHCRSAFISDVHLGTPDCKARYLLDFLRKLRCEKLYLVGDIIDMEALDWDRVQPGGSEKGLSKKRHLTPGMPVTDNSSWRVGLQAVRVDGSDG
ncbi:MAG: hypothetical protein WDW36_010132 [Sanguina aurantia]